VNDLVFPIVAPMTCDIDNINMLEQVVMNFQRIRQVATLFDYVVVYSGSSCAPGVIAMTTCGALSLVSGLSKTVLS